MPERRDNATITGVRIWYADGSVADDWESSPDDGVQVIAWLDDQGGATWAWGVDTYQNFGSGRIKYGSEIPTRRFNRILTEAKRTLSQGR